ncbi:MAG: hypothetical protein A4E45_00101 [Methanosaeta sp. PtaB.Bin039]|nr:MAG: hypothetical protein A4E45_00101 [Methanosaeta sp. PtaB.Bin039]
MKEISMGAAIALLLGALLMAGTSSAYPLQGSNGVVSCVIFDGFRTPNEGNSSTLHLDMAVPSSLDANFELMDNENAIHPVDVNMSWALQTGRVIVSFVIPYKAEPVALRIIPNGSEPFTISWEQPPKLTNGVTNMRYYGLANWQIAQEGQAMMMDVFISNNGTSGDLVVAPENFSIVDQWGWRYYAEQNFEPTVIPPKNFMRAKVTFSEMSSRSRPMLLEFDSGKATAIIVALEPLPTEQAADEQTKPAATTTAAETSPVEQAAANNSTDQPAAEVQTLTQPGETAATLPQTAEEKVQAQRDKMSALQSMMKVK